jgi:two-component system response regulator GlrR
VNPNPAAATTPLGFSLPLPKREAPVAAQRRKARILVVDDDPGLLRLLTIRLRAENYEVEAFDSAAGALGACARFRPDLVLTDLRMDNMDGIGLLKELHSRWPGLRVIILTAHGTIPDAVHATQSGAFGFLTKPVEKQELLEQVQKALKFSGFALASEEWRAPIVTRSALMEDRLSQANMVAGTDARVLLSGETGTGKRLLARAIHNASPRRNKPFAALNCNAVDPAALQAELVAALQSADGGTLLLEEVSQLPLPLQLLLMRVLQDNQVRPADGGAPVSLNVRIISSTHRELLPLVTVGQFREDLFYRLNVVHIELPSLAQRREDIPLLVAHFLGKIARETGERRIYAPEALEVLASADWPGNVRQLSNTVRQNVALASGPIVTAELVEQSLGGSGAKLPSFDEARDEFTRNYLSQILQVTGGNVSQAARLAKRNRTDFYKLLGRHQLLPDDFKKV